MQGPSLHHRLVWTLGMLATALVTGATQGTSSAAAVQSHASGDRAWAQPGTPAETSDLPAWTLLDPAPTRAEAATFLAQVVRQVAANNYAAAWQSLYPPHQVVAPLATYVNCELKSPIPGHLARLKLVHAWWTQIRVAGQQQRQRGVKVKFSLRISDPALGAAVDLQPTFAALWIGWRWAWMLPSARYQMYLTNSC
jgi:hypothetical protein